MGQAKWEADNSNAVKNPHEKMEDGQPDSCQDKPQQVGNPRSKNALIADFFGDLSGRALWVVFGCLVCQIGLGYGYVLGPLAGDMLKGRLHGRTGALVVNEVIAELAELIEDQVARVGRDELGDKI